MTGATIQILVSTKLPFHTTYFAPLVRKTFLIALLKRGDVSMIDPKCKMVFPISMSIYIG